MQLAFSVCVAHEAGMPQIPEVVWSKSLLLSPIIITIIIIIIITIVVVKHVRGLLYRPSVVLYIQPHVPKNREEYLGFRRCLALPCLATHIHPTPSPSHPIPSHPTLSNIGASRVLPSLNNHQTLLCWDMLPSNAIRTRTSCCPSSVAVPPPWPAPSMKPRPVGRRHFPAAYRESSTPSLCFPPCRLRSASSELLWL